MRLIDADHFLKTLNKCVNEHESPVWQKIAETMTFMVEMECTFCEITLPEQKKGTWLDDQFYLPRCSECGGKAYGLHAFDAVKSKYCPHCGAEMEVDDATD